MRPKPEDECSDHDLFRIELVNLIDQRHQLAKLADRSDRLMGVCPAVGHAVRVHDGAPGAADEVDGGALYLKHV
jgi:IS5 family transposase